jgi:hypothetical protein
MNYEVKFTSDEERRRLLGPLPREFVGAIEAGLADLAADPWGKSRIPASPPFAPIGREFTVKCKEELRVHIVYFFFHIDDTKKLVIIRRCFMLPPYVPPSERKKPYAR